MINKEFPHQVLVLADNVRGNDLDRVIKFHDELSVPIRSRSARKDDEWYAIYCFAKREHALAFQLAFGGKLVER
jgi:hypothetical protein